MTIAQQLERKGFEKGFKEGFKEGIHRGMQQTIQKCMQRCREEGVLLDIHAVAHLFLQEGIDYNTVMQITGLGVEELTPLSN